MIKKALLLTFILVVSYGVLFRLRPIITTQDMMHGNIARAQDYLYNNPTNKMVIVGSSIGEKILADSLFNTYSLAFGGLSVFDGLKIIALSNNMPKVVLIETNKLEKSENFDFTSYFSNPILQIINGLFPFTRADARPIGYAIKGINYPVSRIFNDKQQKSGNNIESKLTNNLLQNQKNEYSSVKDSIKIRNNFKELVKRVNQLKSKGCKVIFFEVPVDTSLRMLPRAVYVRKLFDDYSLSKGFIFIKPPLNNLESIDGIHLNETSAIVYTHYFEQMISDIEN